MNVIEVEAAIKTYRIGVGRGRVRELLPHPFDQGIARMFPEWWSRDTFNAVDGVTIDVPQGSTLGIVGHNGAGKTTLLKLIAGVIEPTSGSVRVKARMGALIDLFVGFHQELTGRENLYLLGAVYGFGRREMDRRVDGILDFAGITELADTPLKRYSAGMGARLAFSTITALDLEIMLVDEVLAVGDAAFQRKCVEWLQDFVRGNGSLLFVSHNLQLVRHMTESVIWLDHGKVVEQGPTGDILGRYVKSMEGRESDRPATTRAVGRDLRRRGQRRWGVGGARLNEVHIDADGDGRCSISITFDAEDLREGIFAVGFTDAGGTRLGGTSSDTVQMPVGPGQIGLDMALPFRAGIYFPTVAILSTDGRIRDQWRLDRAVVIEEKPHALDAAAEFGPVELKARWS
jgi:ABC-type polysaccharide/polyol phosphate transport system ATPase subunit